MVKTIPKIKEQLFKREDKFIREKILTNQYQCEVKKEVK